MLRKFKKLLKNNLIGKNDNIGTVREEITFPGGITPIDQTNIEDVFIVGFPKSGNTLLQHIIAHLVYGLNEEGSRSMVNLIVPDIYANSHYFRLNDRCFFKSHERPQPTYKKVIYIMRDGRSALLSYYHMKRNMGEKISLDDLYRGKIHIYGGLWHNHIEAWEDNPYNADILWLKYEDVKNDKLTVLNRTSDFLKLERTQNELEKIIKLSSLDHMRSLEARNDWKKMKANQANKGNFVGTGKSNAYKNEVSEQLLSEFENQNQIMLNKYYS